MERSEFFKDKGLLFFIFSLEMISFYLHFSFIENTLIFIIPLSLFGFLGVLELWYIVSRN